MTGENHNMELAEEGCGDELLQKLLHLKRYETPEIARMTRNRQNIMRQVREATRSKRRSFSELIEVSFPWLFAEPKYGVALLFIAFMGLQYIGANARHAAQSDTGIYTSTMSAEQLAAYDKAAATETNSIEYPRIPDNLQLFPEYSDSDDIKWINYLNP